MKILEQILNKIFAFDKEPQKVGLSQFKPNTVQSEPDGPSLRRKDVKLSDLMRRAG